ncbi:NAD(P)/FAD-dependent oxidoreductase, partial [Microbacterium sp. Bi128]|uniref:flavin monoamine oxidase family protein n=1 Tax=Microbacterium sp. Bi128 TaxID=2821115 RepID=UPI001E467C40
MTIATELPAPRSAAEAGAAPITMLNPDFPFSYDHYLAHPEGLGSVPPELYGTEVAVVGAGLSGLVTAYELMKLGLRPVVYEADRIGGRLRTASFPSAPGIVADLGGMRFPESGKAFYHYVDLLGLQTRAFPNPLAPATSSTVIELAGQKYYAETAADLPPFFREVADAWKAAVNDGAAFAEMQDAIRARDTARIKDLWNALLPQLDEQTFYGFIAGSDSFKEAGFAHREAFGQVGFGTGGWDTDFPNSILEILRVVYTDADDRHRLIDGGAQRLPEALWEHAPSGMAHWPDGTSLASLHAGAPRGAVDRIARDGGGDFRIRERWGRESAYPAVVTTCQSWLLSTRIHTDEALFPAELCTAIERSHYMQSSKTFVMVDRPFWKVIDPATGREVLSMTLTDRLNRATYLLDNGPDQPAVILLSYTWNDDALKWLSLTAEERAELMLHSLQQIYP